MHSYTYRTFTSFFTENYTDSIFHEWEQKIIKGQKAEEDRIEKQCKECELSGWDSEEVANQFGDDFVRAGEVSNYMYAALIVSIWSMIEFLLKGILHTSCKVNHITYNPRLVDFRRIKCGIRKYTGIDEEECKNYEIVNAVRILNNTFKHNNGRYKESDDRPNDKIEKSLQQKWEIEARRQIKYSQLPIAEIVVAINGFCKDLIAQVECTIAAKDQGSKN